MRLVVLQQISWTHLLFVLIVASFFSENWMLKEHKRVTHDERILKCEICNVEVVGLNKMKAHKQKHKQKECQKCSLLVFANSWSAHQSKCSETQLKCNICSYETSRKGNLQTHIKSVHNTVEKEKVQIDHKCVHCKKSFKMKKGLDRHLMSWGQATPHQRSWELTEKGSHLPLPALDPLLKKNSH